MSHCLAVAYYLSYLENIISIAQYWFLLEKSSSRFYRNKKKNKTEDRNIKEGRGEKRKKSVKVLERLRRRRVRGNIREQKVCDDYLLKWHEMGGEPGKKRRIGVGVF